MTQLFSNNASARLNGAVTILSTVITVDDITGFPSPNGDDYFLVTLDDGINTEIVRCTSIIGNDLIVIRGVEGASFAFADGVNIELRVTAETIASIKDAIATVDAKAIAIGGASKAFSINEEAIIDLSSAQPTVNVVATKSLAKTGYDDSTFRVPSGVERFELDDSAYAINVTPSAITGEISLTLASAAWLSTDVGKTFKGNGGICYITSITSATVAVAKVTADFKDVALILSGSWSLESAAYAVNAIGISGGSYEIGFYTGGGFVGTKSVAATTTKTVDCAISTDGTLFFILEYGSILKYSMLTAYDITTLDYIETISMLAWDSECKSIQFSPSGEDLYLLGDQGNDITQFSMPTPYDIANLSFVQTFAHGYSTSTSGLFISKNGAELLFTDFQTARHFTMSIAWDVSTAILQNSYKDYSTGILAFNDDGSQYLNHRNDSDQVKPFDLSVSYDISTAVLSSPVLSTATSVDSLGGCYSYDGVELYITDDSGDSIDQYSTGQSLNYRVTNQYIPVITKAVNQIDSSLWTDINSAAITDTLAGQNIYYCMSTDGRAAWQISKVTDGARSIARDNAGTWEYNSNVTYTLTTWTAATINSEVEAIKQAMTVVANRMDSIQADAVGDADWFAAGVTLDFCATLYTAANANNPSFTSALINHDSTETVEKTAVLGTDYEVTQPNDLEVRFKALVADTFTVRVT